MAKRPSTTPDGPPRERVARAIRESGGTEQGKVMKVLYLDEKGEAVGEWHSQQLPDNPFEGMNAVMDPPYSLEQLVFLAEAHPVHSAALEQKTADIIGKGWEWQADDADAADENLRDEISDWFESLSPDDVDMKELLSAVWNDVETVGWGLLECARDPSGNIRRVYHVPGHTVRAHKSGFKLLQIRDQRRVWFRRWGATDVNGQAVEVDSKTGSMTTVRDPANDLFVIKRPSRRSSWYGIPGYISAVGWITLALAARDDNLMFFQNRREPRWAIILYNLEDDPNIEEDIRRAFAVDMRQPHRNVVIPIKGQGKIDFQKMSADLRLEGSFDRLSDRADRAIAIAHRVPGDRIANSQIGPLGGNTVAASSRVYKEGVVQAGQEILNSRLNRFIAIEWARQGAGGKATGNEEQEKVGPGWKLAMDDLDIDTDRNELDLAAISFHSDLITLREARADMGRGPLMKTVKRDANGNLPVDSEGNEIAEGTEIESEYNDMLYTEIPGAAGTAGSPTAAPGGTGGFRDIAAARDDSDPALALLDADLREAIQASREVQERLDEMADRERERDEDARAAERRS